MIKKFFILLLCSLLFSCSNRNKVEIFYVKAVEAYSKKDFTAALNFSDLTLKNDSDFYQAKLLKAKILYFENSLEKSFLILKKLIKKYPEYTDARIWFIRVLLAQSKYDEAEKYLIKELSFNSGDCRVFYQYGNLCSKLNRMDERLSMYRKAEELLRENSKIYLELADVWLALGMKDRALDELDKAELLSDDKQTIKELKNYIKKIRY
ncbi:tetratricopeptide repeat protein [uncultured Treponema sp.]|uniref:tetratricopeptide repeat protein n=1 Tax=uncultured Treponema sp. TaxID=162155 RepID=UPI00258BDE2C|nr:tetratricopeptide repeat protein [uncultured Treponema sp.]